MYNVYIIIRSCSVYIYTIYYKLHIQHAINRLSVHVPQTVRYLNRIMFDRDECKSDLRNDSTILTAELSEDDYRCVHIKNVL